MEFRRFVVCFDGTWNAPDKGANPTNVVKMVRAISGRDGEGVSQVVFYDKGVGTAGGTDKFTGGGLGNGLTANVVDGYRFLANNYEPGDEIYIFGFSRGAYTARSLAGLIGMAGLLHPDDLGGGLRDVMEIYSIIGKPREDKVAMVDALDIRERDRPRIKCVGVWDTVGSLGIPGDYMRRFMKKYYFHDVELGEHVDVALHAVAIDEKRSAFAPTLWVSDDGKPKGDAQVVEQVWFPGAHSNVGGSYADCGLSDIAFDWMAKRVARHTGLALVIPGVDVTANAGAKSIDSRTLLYAESRLYPYQRIICRVIPKGGGIGDWFRRKVPAFDRRNIPPDGLLTVHEKVHVCALLRWRLDAVPNDCRTDKDSKLTPYRPVTLEALLKARAGGLHVPVVGWDGEEMTTDIPWPD